jgi:hypothetical protein
MSWLTDAGHTTFLLGAQTHGLLHQGRAFSELKHIHVSVKNLKKSAIVMADCC